MMDRLLRRLAGFPGFLSLWHAVPIGPLETKVRYDVLDRPPYAYGVYSAADLARRVGLDAVQVIEFGVAGGQGLLALEKISSLAARHFGMRIHVTGFDSGPT